MIINKLYLVCRNARDKVQIVIAELEQNANIFTIRRTTGQYLGKMTEQPELTIEKGKVKRSVLEQAELEFNSVVKKYLDKGYKELSTLIKKNFEELTPEEINEIVPSVKSDQNGFKKPMLAKQSEKVAESTFNKPLLCSRKLNGVRAMISYNSDNETINVVSRGGKEYNSSTEHLIPELMKIFELYPNITLDGELYHHGHYLQELSGIARLKTWEPRCEILQYWIYDICDDSLKFTQRLSILKDIVEETSELGLKRVNILSHVETQCWKDMQKLHDNWVEEGFEGLVARKPDKIYKYGSRGSDMIKVKLYKDFEAEIIDYRDGLRPEDFCFVLQTKEGKPFAAKPIGDRQLKEWYLNNIDDLIGKMGTVKYFEWSKDGIPQQPIFQNVRYEEDLPNEND